MISAKSNIMLFSKTGGDGRATRWNPKIKQKGFNFLVILYAWMLLET